MLRIHVICLALFFLGTVPFRPALAQAILSQVEKSPAVLQPPAAESQQPSRNFPSTPASTPDNTGPASDTAKPALPQLTLAEVRHIWEKDLDANGKPDAGLQSLFVTQRNEIEKAVQAQLRDTARKQIIDRLCLLHQNMDNSPKVRSASLMIANKLLEDLEKPDNVAPFIKSNRYPIDLRKAAFRQCLSVHQNMELFPIDSSYDFAMQYSAAMGSHPHVEFMKILEKRLQPRDKSFLYDPKKVDAMEIKLQSARIFMRAVSEQRTLDVPLEEGKTNGTISEELIKSVKTITARTGKSPHSKKTRIDSTIEAVNRFIAQKQAFDRVNKSKAGLSPEELKENALVSMNDAVYELVLLEYQNALVRFSKGQGDLKKAADIMLDKTAIPEDLLIATSIFLEKSNSIRFGSDKELTYFVRLNLHRLARESARRSVVASAGLESSSNLRSISRLASLDQSLAAHGFKRAKLKKVGPLKMSVESKP